MSLTALYDLPAPAKLNLFLHVIGRRPDGYHLLQSAFVMIDWADTLHIERRGDGLLRRHDLGPALPEDDLCLRAARALQQASGTTLGADISIDKQVPWGAGMGGGSSDAATVLLALNRLWGLDWSRERLLSLGLTLGADVPFFIGGRTAWVEGIGEQLTPIELAPMRFAVVKPPMAIPTAKIFSSELLTRDTNAATVAGLLDENATRDRNDERNGSEFFGRNDLQAAAEAICPEVTQAVDWLRQRFGNGRMTGSGSAVFASVGAGDLPVATLPDDKLLQGLPDGWVGRLCRSVDQHPLWGWAS